MNSRGIYALTAMAMLSSMSMIEPIDNYDSSGKRDLPGTKPEKIKRETQKPKKQSESLKKILKKAKT